MLLVIVFWEVYVQASVKIEFWKLNSAVNSMQHT